MFTAHNIPFLVTMVATVGFLGLTGIVDNNGPTFAVAAPPILVFCFPAMVRRAVAVLEKRATCDNNDQCKDTSCNYEELAECNVEGDAHVANHSQ